ncbi:MAG: hypothetical protein WC889_00380 [Myxococcota bacterium]
MRPAQSGRPNRTEAPQEKASLKAADDQQDGHKAIAVDATEQLDKITHQATAPGPCNALEQSLDTAAKQISETAEEAQDKHGASAKPFALE